jgi:Flp pilus assembly pilin Flp
MKREEFSVSGDDVIKTIKKIIAEGNARRIIIKKENGETLVEFPLTVGVVGVAIIPVLTAIGALTALIAKCTIIVEKREPGEPAEEAEKEGEIQA